MNKEANKLANRINKLFNDKTITDVLKLSNSTRYGEEMPEIYVFLDSSLKEGFIAIENISTKDIWSIVWEISKIFCCKL